MMSKHTQGEWRARGTEGCVGTEGQLVACVYPMAYQNPEELAANMRLIAASPRMYEYIASSALNGCAEAAKILESIYVSS
jgi:hypothetical protein